MPFDGSGNYTPPSPEYPVVSGTPILAADWNAIIADIATALSGVITRDGQSPPSASIPMGSQKITGLAPGTASTDAVNLSQLQQFVPPGVMMDYAGAAAPTGFLLCDGSAHSRTTQAALFAAIGTTWGAGDGVTTFNVPDFRRRVAVGSGGAGTGTLGNAVGNTGGAETHVLTTAELAAHAHGVNDPQHGHGVNITDPGHNHLWGDNSQVGSGAGAGNFGGTGAGSASNTSSSATGITAIATNAATGISIQNAGGGGAHNNMQPSAVVTKIIKT